MLSKPMRSNFMLSNGKTDCFTHLLLSVVVASFSVAAQAQSVAPTTATEAEVVESSEQECVILLHGLARTSASMNNMESALLEAGFAVANVDYPSRKQTVQQLATPTINKGLLSCEEQGYNTAHVVTHSMGGILFRQYVEEHGGARFGRTIMLAPPNQGSEVVDALRDVPGFQFLNGPAGQQMGTDKSSVPLQLGPAGSHIAIVAGTFSINLLLSNYLPNPDDGKVSVESTRLDGMCAHLQVDVSHPYIMADEDVIAEVIAYLNAGRFLSAKAEYPSCKFPL